MLYITRIHMQITQYKYTSGTLLFRYEPFISFWLRFFDTKRETILKSISYHTMLTTPQRSAHLVVQSQFLKTMVGRQLLIIIVGHQLLNTMVGTQLQLSTSMADNPTVCLHCPKSTLNWLFFKIFQFSGPSLPGVTSFILQPISYLRFIMTIVIVISFAQERKLYPMLCTWTKSRIVQSPTKLNDKI